MAQQHALEMQRQQNRAPLRAVLGGLVFLATVGVIALETCSSYKKSSDAYDADYCAQNLTYYENFCKAWPDNCKEGARKLARCK